MDGSSISMGGQISGPTSAAGHGDLVKNSDTQNFMKDVIETSRQVPVIVDFWAPWCGPCKQLGPVIEKLVREASGAVRLVKVNIDENQALAGQMRVQSIPAVYAFSGGQPVDAFMGALPESEIKAFISKLTGPSAADQQIEQLLSAGLAALADKQYSAAIQAFGQVLQIDPQNTAALAGMAKCQIETGDVDGASATLELAPPDKQDDPEIASARAALELATTAVDSGEIAGLTDLVNADRKNHQARFDLALALNAQGDREQALDHLLTIVQLQRDWNNDAARQQLLTFFEAWGLSDELTVAGRRRLSSILFS